ncbi:MAG: glycoside hydrolase family 9 protein [Anaerolineae bacterium]|nr:glycoside hydrolase family 9 protein [Anaerolineae bacterium]
MDLHPVSGLLVSQIGYDLHAPMRALYRGATRDAWGEEATFALRNADDEALILRKPLVYWGACWHSHWWIADFSELAQPGAYRLTIAAPGAPSVASDPFRVAAYLLWETTIRTVALDQFEARAELARYGQGWKDCGSDWREVGSHTAALIGLLDLLNIGYEWLGREDALRLARQVIHGCDYLATCQQRAGDLGWPEGALVHEMPNYPVLIPQDQGQSVVALARASRHIYEIDPARALNYLERAVNAYTFLTRHCRPSSLPNFSARLHGAPEGYMPTSFMTGDLLMMIWGAVALAKSGRPAHLDEAVRRARELLRRQVPQEAAEGDFYGHFYAFEDCAFTEKAFIHHHVGHDTSMMFNHYIAPLIDLCAQLPDHPEAPRWRQAIHDFAYGYFLPACRKNPCYLLPQGYYAGEGLLSFGGPWHGFNVCYGYAAALAVQFETFFGDSQFRDIAVGNLQWIAGLNSGMTAESFEGSVMWREAIPAGAAIPYSHIHGIGTRAVETWSKIPGSIGNGYCTNRQFRMEVLPSVENDGPWRYADEDWIPHAGGWVSGLTYLRQVTGWEVGG